MAHQQVAEQPRSPGTYHSAEAIGAEIEKLVRQATNAAYNAGKSLPPERATHQESCRTTMQQIYIRLDSLRVQAAREARAELRHRAVAELRELLDEKRTKAPHLPPSHPWKEAVQSVIDFLESLVPSR